MLLLPRVCKNQPQSLVEINWANPLTKDLIIATQILGTKLVNVVDHKVAVVWDNVTSVIPIVKGKAFNYVSGGAHEFTNVKVNNTNKNHTQIHLFKVTDTLTYQGLASLNDSGGIGHDRFLYQFQGFGVARELIFWNYQSGQTNLGYYPNTNSDFGKYITLVCVYNAAASTISVYVNGTFIRTTVVNATIHPSSIGYMIGSDYYSRNDSVSGPIAQTLVFNRALSATEVKELSSNIWQVFKINSVVYLPNVVQLIAPLVFDDYIVELGEDVNYIVKLTYKG